MNYKVIAAFVAGAACGGLIGAFLMKDKYERESQEAINSVKEHYKKLEEIRQEKKSVEEKTKEAISSIKEYGNNAKKEFEVKAREYLEEHSEERSENLGPTEYPDKPYTISEDQYMDDNLHYSKETVYWYEVDEILVDEENDILVDPASLIGHDIQNEIDDQKDDGTFTGIIYIRNDRISRDFEVYIEEGTFPAGGDYGDD